MMIRTENLVKQYGDFTAVDNITLNIPSGEIYGFLGPNGAGKTTTIKMLLGIVPPTSGKIYLFDEEFGPERLDLRKKIGMVPENHPAGMWSWMTGLDYLRFFARLFEVDKKVEDSSARIHSLLEQVDLLKAKDKKITEYSRGMLQKLSILRALLHDPDILFLDEPISGLDPLGIKQIRDLLLSENREGRTIFISSHLLSEVEKICRRVAIIYNGSLKVEDSMGNILSNLSTEREIRIELESIPEKLTEEMKKLEFVLDSRGEENTLIVTISKEGDFRKAISSFLIGKDLVPLSMNEKTMSLEEAFVTITKESIEILSGPGAASGSEGTTDSEKTAKGGPE
jgi:ABC-type multidrug transport system ATPase subunit